MKTERHGKLRWVLAAAGVLSLGIGMGVGACTSVEQSMVKPGAQTLAVTPDNGYLSPPYPVFPHGNTLTMSLADSDPQVQRFVNFYSQVGNITFPNLTRDSLTRLPNRYLDIAHNGLNVSSGDFNSSLVCQSCHDSDWKAQGTNLGNMEFWQQPSVSTSFETQPPNSLVANWSLFGDWSASIKALAARDPVFLAQVENTRSLSPNQPEQVDNLCLRCHSPLGQRQAEKNNLLFSHYMLYSTPSDSDYNNPFPKEKYSQPDYAVYGALGRDGVSCSSCHATSPKGGLPWDGKDYTVFYGSDTQSVYGSGVSDRLRDQGEKTQPPPFPFSASMNTRPGTVVGPDSGLNDGPMAAAGLSLETASTVNAPDHNYLRDATVCGSCHVVVLPKVPDQYSNKLTIQQAVARGGYVKPASCPPTQTNFTGNFLTDPCVGLAYEQTTYFEWLNSGFATQTASCLTCHMQLASPVNNEPGDSNVAQVNNDLTKFYGSNTDLTQREYNRHTLLGINQFVHEMFQQFPDVLGIQYYLKNNSAIPPYLQDPSILNRTGNLVANPGAEAGNANGWMAAGSQIQAVKSAPGSGGTVVQPNHGQYFFSIGGGKGGGDVTLSFDVSQYADTIDAGTVKVIWGGASYCLASGSCQALVLSQDTGGSPTRLASTTPGQWAPLEGSLGLAPGTRKLTLTLLNGSLVDDLFLALELPVGSFSPLEDARRQYTLAQNLLNAEQSILDLAVNTSQGEFNPRTPAVQVLVGTPTVNGSNLNATVTLKSNVGHKFPSGAGFRRAFIQFEVLDAAGNVLWASGQPNTWGAICQGVCQPDGKNVLPSEFTSDYRKLQPHYQKITDQTQAQIYEVRVLDDYNQLTSTELQQFTDVKDNRILPRGWVPPASRSSNDQALGLNLQQLALLTEPKSTILGSNDTSVSSDPDYSAASAPGADSIVYQIPLSKVSGWQSVRARLNYQTIPPFYLNARFKEALKDSKGNPTTPGPAMSRLLYMTSRLNTQGGLQYTPVQQSKPIDFMNSWTLVLGEKTQQAP